MLKILKSCSVEESQREGAHSPLPSSGFVTTGWVKRHFSISNSTLYAWCASGVLPPMYRVGPRAMRFRAEDIARFEQERMAGTSKQMEYGKNG